MIEPNFVVKVEVEKSGYGMFVIEPLVPCYGHTLGNSLRRVLLSSLQGTALTSVKIAGVAHQFSALSGLKEDIVELIMHLKKVRLTLEGSDSAVIKLSKKGPCVVTAADFDVSAGVTIVNPDQIIATLSDKKAELNLEATVGKGYGYVHANEMEVGELGKIPMDALFSPVFRVNYRVDATRVGRMTNLDKLVMEIWTDETISPADALREAAKGLVSFFLQVYEPKEKGPEESVVVTPSVSDEVLKMRIEELDIPTRIVNALSRGNIETIGQLLATPRSELMKIKNLGGKSLTIVEEKLKEKGVSINV